MRNVFFSFHYGNDSWRVQQIINMGIVDGQKICNPNEWETIKRRSDDAIQKWIDENMRGRSCVVVLIGSQTANREWVQYEIEKAWNDGKALLGVYIHGLKNQYGAVDRQGKNPFDNFSLRNQKLSDFIPIFEPNFYNAYSDIKDNLSSQIEFAIKNKKK